MSTRIEERANKQLERTVMRQRTGHVIARPLNCGVRRQRL
jgi:hypothetical protein